MTTTQIKQPESKAPSRRALLAGLLGGVGAIAAGAIGRVSSVRAANGDPVLVGGTFTGTANTTITTTSQSAYAGNSSQDGADAIVGFATSATGVSWGVRGRTNSTTGTGVVGQAHSTTGDATGVRGEADSNVGVGVLGRSNSSQGTNYGVYGRVLSPSGFGVVADNNGGGVALKTIGRLKFSTSGVASLSAGSTSKTIFPGVVTSSSFVLLTPKVNLGTRALWFTTNNSADSFTIHISSARSSTTRIAWLLVG